jgi:hypothetical protein
VIRSVKVSRYSSTSTGIGGSKSLGRLKNIRRNKKSSVEMNRKWNLGTTGPSIIYINNYNTSMIYGSQLATDSKAH